MTATTRKIRLTGAQKAFVVQRLACFDTPREVAQAFMEEFGVHLAPQNIEAYDPTKRAGKHLSQKWRDLFDATRKEFLEHISMHVPGAHKAVRVKKLWNAAQAFERRGNYVAMADMMERIAKEMGNVHTNRREISGKDGKPIEYADMSREQLDAEVAQLLRGAGISVVTGDEDEADAGSGATVH